MGKGLGRIVLSSLLECDLFIILQNTEITLLLPPCLQLKRLFLVLTYSCNSVTGFKWKMLAEVSHTSEFQQNKIW